MRIVCPSCEAAYDVPATVLAAGRTLRCARCGADFTPPVPVSSAETAAAQPLAPASTAVAPRPASAAAPLLAERLVIPAASDERAPRSGRIFAVLAGWVLSLVVLAALAWAFVAWRGPIQRAWPASERVYALLGLK